MKIIQIIIENIFRLTILRKLEIEFSDKIFCSILIIKTRIKLIMTLLDMKYSVVTSSIIEGMLSSATEINIIKTNADKLLILLKGHGLLIQRSHQLSYPAIKCF